MSLHITGNPILDFTVIQAMSVLYLSDSALHLVKWQNSENQYIREFFEPPAAAWYNKAVGTGLKAPNEAAKPCMITTAYGIQTICQLAHILPDYRVLSCLPLDSLYSEWKAIAALQLEFCLEYQRESFCTPGECASILEGGSYFLKVDCPDGEHPDFMPPLQELYHKITEDLDIAMVSTIELARIIRGISVWFRNNNNKHRSEFLIFLALEILNRKNRSGLFYSTPEGFSSAPSGHQFFILDALLESYPFIQLDHVLEEIFDLFSNLYRIAYKEAIEMFSFKRRSISYSAFEIGALLACLNKLATYSTNISGQRDTINNTIDSFLDLLIRSYNQIHEKEIKRLDRWICMYHLGKIRRKDKPLIRTVFPKRVRFSFSHQEIDWSRKGVISQAGVFFLCTSLLSLISEKDINHKKDIEINIDIPTMEAVRALLELFVSQ
jgi:hypothetical protein